MNCKSCQVLHKSFGKQYLEFSLYYLCDLVLLPQSFIEGDIMWRKMDDAREKSSYRKLVLNCEGLFRVVKKFEERCLFVRIFE